MKGLMNRIEEITELKSKLSLSSSEVFVLQILSILEFNDNVTYENLKKYLEDITPIRRILND